MTYSPAVKQAVSIRTFKVAVYDGSAEMNKWAVAYSRGELEMISGRLCDSTFQGHYAVVGDYLLIDDSGLVTLMEKKKFEAAYCTTDSFPEYVREVLARNTLKMVGEQWQN